MALAYIYELMAEHTFGYQEPSQIRMGCDAHRDFVRDVFMNYENLATSLGHSLTLLPPEWKSTFHGANVVYDENLLSREVVVHPAYAAIKRNGGENEYSKMP